MFRRRSCQEETVGSGEQAIFNFRAWPWGTVPKSLQYSSFCKWPIVFFFGHMFMSAPPWAGGVYPATPKSLVPVVNVPLYSGPSTCVTYVNTWKLRLFLTPPLLFSDKLRYVIRWMITGTLSSFIASMLFWWSPLFILAFRSFSRLVKVCCICLSNI